MQRAVVAIGVKKTGGLPELQAAVESAEQFATWARELQKIPASRVKLITDAKGPVSRDRIFDTIEKITQLGIVEQLIVYFSGHGINSGLFEQWLLSKAPVDPNAAVNVKGSEFGARFCGIEHVVFISDACRTAADSIQAQRVAGGDIFPNATPGGTEKAVDQFFATQVGDPAFEVQTVAESTKRYCAAYSTVLLQALRGETAALIEAEGGRGVVRPRPLKHHLTTAVPAFFNTLNLGVASQPAARVESEPDAWLSEVAAPAAAPVPAAPAAAAGADGGPKRRRAGAPRRQGGRLTGDEALPPVGGSAPARVPSLERDASLQLRAALDPAQARKRGSAGPRERGMRALGVDAATRRYDDLVSGNLTVFGPDHFETECGIKVRGTTIASAHAPRANAIVGARNDAVRVALPNDRRGANVLVRLADGSAVIAPAFRDYITGLSFDARGNLQDVWCEPSANTRRWREYQANADEIRRVRAVIAAASALGVFRLDEADTGRSLLDRLRRVKALDPALAVYAAHAFSDRRLRAHIVDMQRYLDDDLRVRIFDVAMLAFSLGAKPDTGSAPLELYPCVPMLTQGWALLSQFNVTLPGRLGTFRGDLRPSLWTHFAADAADRLQDALQRKGID
jgi:hypothetical protein